MCLETVRVRRILSGASFPISFPRVGEASYTNHIYICIFFLPTSLTACNLYIIKSQTDKSSILTVYEQGIVNVSLLSLMGFLKLRGKPFTFPPRSKATKKALIGMILLICMYVLSLNRIQLTFFLILKCKMLTDRLKSTNTYDNSPLLTQSAINDSVLV